MGRYKFPGKPTKHVNKKRVNVLSCPSTKSNETSIGYNEFLTTFGINNAYCDTSQANTLSGLSKQEAVHALRCVNSEERKVETDGESSSKCTLLTTNTNVNKMTLKENQNNEFDSLAILLRSNKPSAFLYNYKNYTVKTEVVAKSKTRSMKDMKRLIKKGPERRIVSKVDVHDSSSMKFSPCSSRKTMYARKRQIKDNRPVSSTISTRETANLVGKFVLPTKSLHSSRVIIPNKRFISNEQIYKTKTNECLTKSSKKTKVVDKKTVHETKKSESEKTVSNKSDLEESVKDVIINSCSDNVTAENSKDSNDMVLIDSTANSNTPWSCGKLVLRKARLQLHTQSSEGMDGPFSNYSAASPSPPGTVTCGVCGAVRFYRFVKQARKFNIYSCESCRKFISKMIKKQTCTKNCAIPTLVCHKGQGMCHVPPIVRSQQWKLLRCAYKARCPACWLKMCLQSFQMPSQLKTSLTSMLPENMRSYDEFNKSQCTEVTLQNKLLNVSQLSQWQNTEIINDLQISSVEKSDISPVKLDILSSKTDTLLNNIKEKRIPKSRTRLGLQKKNAIVSNAESQITAAENAKRQKLDLKGPRVKHVCRSASIVLGQPLATFSREYNADNIEKTRAICEVSSETESCINCTTMSQEHCLNTYEEKCFTLTTNKQSTRDEIPNSGVMSLSSKNVYLTSPQSTADEPCLQNECIKNSMKPIITISADYFDNYDSEGKIYSSGFGLIGSEPFPIQAVCFYCGSAGQEQLLYCACCCEPYHCYCVNENVISRYLNNNIITQSNVNGNINSIWKFSWKCSRCSVCYQCGNTDNKKVSCKLCRRYYHPECMQPSSNYIETQMICSSCLQCEDCGSQNITQLVCNSSLCSRCLKLRMIGKNCPLCQTFDENSNSKMFKCINCKNLVHTDCEKLSYEMNNILHHLPDTSEIACSACSADKISYWKDSVNIALKNGFHIVLRLLTRSRTAREIMKWNLLKNGACSCKSESGSKSLSVSDNVRNNYAPNRLDSDVPAIIKKSNSEKNLDNLKATTSESNKSNCIGMKQTKDNSFDISLKNMRKKFCIKECSVRIKNCVESKEKNCVVKIHSNGCEIENGEDEKNLVKNDTDNSRNRNYCDKHDFMPIVLLLNIKRKINSNTYRSVKEFHLDVQLALKKSFCHELLNVLDTIIIDTFPWYNPLSFETQESINMSLKNSKYDDTDLESNISSSADASFALLKDSCNKTVSSRCISENPRSFDTRTCVLCNKVGDSPAALEGRLLYCGQNEWIHVNCAFWSSDVYEELDCSLQNVHEAISRGRVSECSACKEKGATVCCSIKGCSEIFHYMCARVVNSSFFTSKVICCPSHCDTASGKSGIMNLKDFVMQRPIFVNIDIKKKKHVELSKVQFLIGSLNVTNLGTFFPPLSDTEEAIIPSEFVCSRLFWSTAEPWKIVRYTISTSIFIPTIKGTNETEKNFTVDHSLPNELIEQKIMEISKWNKDLEYGKSKRNLGNPTEYEKESVNITDDDKIALQVLEHVLELICNKEVEDNCDDEPQNTADILPPELKDAIFEDLPHDLLDGISMQDIFPKLMSYEDVITMDLKNSDAIDNIDSLKDSKNDLSSEIVTNVINNEYSQLKGKKPDLFVTGNDFWLEPKYSIQNLEDFVQNGKVISDKNGQQLKRSKSEVFTGIKKLTRTCNHQRSCSLTWSCKLDNTRATNLKKRKMSCTSKNVADISNNLFMLLDGTSEKSSMLQELRLPEGVLMSMGHSTNVDCITDTVRELKYRLEENTLLPGDRYKSQNQEIEHEKENKCRLWRNKSQSRIAQIDGADDSSSASENESYEIETDIKTVKHVLSHASDEPVKCDRCQCTYRTLSSYKRHLVTCDYISSSDSDSEAPFENEIIANIDTSENNSRILNNITIKDVNVTTKVTNLIPKIEDAITASPAITQSSIITTDCKIINYTETNSNNQNLNIATMNSDSNFAMSYAQAVITPAVENAKCNKIIENVPNHIDLKSNGLVQNKLHTNSVVVNNNDLVPTSTVPNIQNYVIPSQISLSENGKISQKVPITKIASVQKPTKQKNTNKSRANVMIAKNKNKYTKTTVKRTIVDKSLNVTNYQSNPIIQSNNSIRLSDVNGSSSGPTVIIQHLSSPNMMPAYVEAFQHQTGQNLQCIATIVPNEYKPAPYITSNSFVPGTFHLQSSESTNVISIPNNGYSVLSGLETISQPQTTVMGTFIQQNHRPSATFHCGMMSTEQIVLGSIPTMDTIVSESPGSMYFSPQPVYYGFETIVQNTVMSSQQFVSSALPGVLASNSSYSATTTQVFQSSKLEPIMDINGTGYILVNPSVPQVAAPMTVNPHPAITPLPSKPTNIITPQPTILESQTTSYPVQIVPVCDPVVPLVEPVLYTEPQIQQSVEEIISYIKPDIACPLVDKPINTEFVIEQCFKPLPVPGNSSSTTASITLPVAPYALENKIPMNIVTPIPQVSASGTTHAIKPTNRVLPMQTAPPQKDFQKSQTGNGKILSVEPPNILNKLSETVDKIQETLQNDAEALQSTKFNTNNSQLLKLESASLKLVFQKQSQDGIYKISNKYVSKNKMPIQITPIKQTKIKAVETTVNVKNNISNEKENKTKNKEMSQNDTKKVLDNSPNIVYKVHSQDGFDYSSTSITEIWKNVFNAVQSARSAHNMPLLPDNAFSAINGLQLLGLRSNGLRYLIEQLPGVGNCIKYKPVCHKKLKFSQYKDNNDISESFKAARCEPNMYTKEPYDMFSWLASKHRNPDYINHIDFEYACRRASSVNLPMAMRFRQLKETSKQAVGVYRSNIHGRGLFCLRDIECGEMVIEYAGEVIRSTLTDKREKYYNSKGIGCYMFRVDDNLVVDATMKGNAARFINHSCDPNCYSRVLDILGHKHILIFALRKIMQGEELTYDYKFPFEEDKIPCTCGAKRCRKYLN